MALQGNRGSTLQGYGGSMRSANADSPGSLFSNALGRSSSAIRVSHGRGSVTESQISNDEIESARKGFRGRQGAKTWVHSASLGDDPNTKQMFVDADAMKEKVRQNLTKPQYSVFNCYHETGVFQHIARSVWFDHLTLVVIAFNAIWLAIDTDFNQEEVLAQAHPIFIIAENSFCCYFTFELFVRFMAFRRKLDGLKDPWFSFDSVLVLTMVLETWVMTVALMVAGGNSGGDLSNASVLRIARLLRLSRMARMARLLRAMPELMTLVKGMFAATRSVFFTLCLLTLLTYIFAIAFTQMAGGTEVGDEYFNSVFYSMYTLLIFGTLLDEIGQLSNALGNESIVFCAVFFVFVLLAALTVMNMLIGVLCEVVSAVAATEKEAMLVGYVSRKVQQIVNELDSDGNGTLSKTEFFKILENLDCARALQEVGVDVEGLVDFADVIFDETPDLTFPKFMEWVLQLRGTNHATVKDIVELRKLVTQKNMQLNDFLTDIGDEIKKNSANIKASRQQLTRRLESTFGKDIAKEWIPTDVRDRKGSHDSKSNSRKGSTPTSRYGMNCFSEGELDRDPSGHTRQTSTACTESEKDCLMGEDRPIPPFNASKPSFMQPVSRQSSDHSDWSFGNENEALNGKSRLPTNAKSFSVMDADVLRLHQDLAFDQGWSNISDAEILMPWNHRLISIAEKAAMATVPDAQLHHWESSCSPVSPTAVGEEWRCLGMDEMRQQLAGLGKVLFSSLEEVQKVQHSLEHRFRLVTNGHALLRPLH